MNRGKVSPGQVQYKIRAVNPEPASTLADYWRDPIGTAAFEQILRTPIAAPRRSSRLASPLAVGAAAVVVLALISAGVLVSTLRQSEPMRPAATAPVLHYALSGFTEPARSLRLPPARSELLRLAKAAAARPPLKQAPGASVGLVTTNEWYMSTAVGGGTSTTVVIPEVDKTWYWPDGAWRLLQRRGRPIIGTVGSEQTLRAALSGAPISDQRFPAHDTSGGPDVSALPTRPAALKAELPSAPPYGNDGQSEVVRLFRAISLLHHQIVGPALDATMWRVLAQQNAVRFLGAVTDRAGRRGDAVEVTDAQAVERLVLIISPATGDLLGSEDMLLKNPGTLNIRTFPAVTGYVTFLSDLWTASPRTSDH